MYVSVPAIGWRHLIAPADPHTFMSAWRL